MKDIHQWEEPDWDLPEPVEFGCFSLRADSAFTAILLAGVVVALTAALWFLAGGS